MVRNKRWAALAMAAGVTMLVFSAAAAGTGTGAAMSGGFKFEGGTLAFANVPPSTANLADVLEFSNTAENYLADVGAISVDYPVKPTRGRVTVCNAGGLTAEAAVAKMSVTVNGEPFGGTNVLIEDGNIVLVMPVGMSFMIR